MKFSELKVGDKLYFYWEGQYIEKEILEKEENDFGVYFKTDWSTCMIFNTEEDFAIIPHVLDKGKITEAIATSMDKLLLEVSE